MNLVDGFPFLKWPKTRSCGRRQLKRLNFIYISILENLKLFNKLSIRNISNERKEEQEIELHLLVAISNNASILYLSVYTGRDTL